LSVRWLRPDTAYLRRQSILANAIGGVLVALSLLLAAFVLPRAWHNDALRAVMLPAVAFIVIALSALWCYLRMLHAAAGEMRLGATADGLRYRLPRWQGALRLSEGTEPWQRVFHDGDRLLAGPMLLLVRTPLGSMFDAREVAETIEPRIPAANRLSGRALTLQAFRAGAFRPALILWAATVALGGALMLLLPHLGPRASP
jgi:hypothetical protein